MLDQVNHLHKELAELVNRHTDREGPQSTGISSLHFSRYSAPHHFTGTGAPYRINKVHHESLAVCQSASSSENERVDTLYHHAA